MPPDEPSPESEKKEAPAEDEAPAKPASAPKKTAATKAPPPPSPASQRTRSIVMMVLATLALTAVLTLIAQSVFTGPTPASSSTTSSGNTPSVPPNGSGGAVTTTGSGMTRPAMPAVPAIFVAVTFDHIEVDGVEVEKIGPLVKSKETGNLGKLASVMELKRGGASTGGPVALAVEQGVPRNVIKSVIGTLALAGYRDVHLVGATPEGGLPEGGAVRAGD